MSVIYCFEHDEKWDSDFIEIPDNCIKCNQCGMFPKEEQEQLEAIQDQKKAGTASEIPHLSLV